MISALPQLIGASMFHRTPVHLLDGDGQAPAPKTCRSAAVGRGSVVVRRLGSE